MTGAEQTTRSTRPRIAGLLPRERDPIWPFSWLRSITQWFDTRAAWVVDLKIAGEHH